MQMAVGKAGKHRETVSFAQLKRVLLPWEKVSDGAVAAHYALRFAGGAGGDSDVGRVIGSYDCCRFAAGESRQVVQNLRLRPWNVHPAAQLQTVQTIH